MPELVYLNGRLLPPDQAFVSIDDRGFLFGDAVYEALRSYEGRVWALARHMRRLARSLTAIEMANVDVDRVGVAIQQTYEANQIPNALIYVQVTRGVARRSHAFPRDLEPTVLVTVRDISPILAGFDQTGMAAVTAPDLRWRRCDIKSTNLLPNVLAKTHAHDRGGYEAILVDADGYVTEGSSTSVFWVRNRRLFTSPAGPEILPSITREFVVEIARDGGIPVLVEQTPVEQFRESDEVFLASTTPEICPIISLDGTPVGSGRAGPVTLRLAEALRACIAAGDDAPR